MFSGVVSVDVSHDVTKIVCSTLDSTIHVWDLATGEKIKKIDNAPMDSWTSAFSPDSKQIISGAQNGKIHFFNTESGQKEQHFDTRGKYILSIAYVSSKLGHRCPHCKVSERFEEKKLFGQLPPEQLRVPVS